MHIRRAPHFGTPLRKLSAKRHWVSNCCCAPVLLKLGPFTTEPSCCTASAWHCCCQSGSSRVSCSKRRHVQRQLPTPRLLLLWPPAPSATCPLSAKLRWSTTPARTSYTGARRSAGTQHSGSCTASGATTTRPRPTPRRRGPTHLVRHPLASKKIHNALSRRCEAYRTVLCAICPRGADRRRRAVAKLCWGKQP